MAAFKLDEGMSKQYTSDDERWAAVVESDPAADGVFFLGVLTTGIYCRPTCSARRPNRENVVFFDSREKALKDGFRACKRCKPELDAAKDAGKAANVVKACRMMDDAETPPSLADLADEVGIGARQLHRQFMDIIGISPKDYAEGKRTQAVRDALKSADSVTAAIYDAGYNAPSRFYEKSEGFLGMTPSEFRNAGRGKTVRYAIRPCSLGVILIAATDKGLCCVRFGDDAEALEKGLHVDFAEARREMGDPDFTAWADALLELVETGQQPSTTLPVDIQGTAFQQKVWAALHQLPAGARISYGALAERLDMPKGARAVASACASNKVAVAIPCHRVVGKNGKLTGYRWGVERKKALLDRERDNNPD